MTPLEQFETFWKAYPRKVAKKTARDKWSRIKMTDELFAKIIAAVEVQKKQPQWVKDGGQFIPHPSTWLFQERWDDEVDSGASTKYNEYE